MKHSIKIAQLKLVPIGSGFFEGALIRKSEFIVKVLENNLYHTILKKARLLAAC